MAAEPWASLTDVFTASQRLEDAIHAPSYSVFTSAITGVNTYLQYAYDYLTKAPNPPSSYGKIAQVIGQTQTNLQMLANGAKGLSTAAFKAYQLGPVYDFQGQMSALASMLNDLWLTSPKKQPGYYQSPAQYQTPAQYPAPPQVQAPAPKAPAYYITSLEKKHKHKKHRHHH